MVNSLNKYSLVYSFAFGAVALGVLALPSKTLAARIDNDITSGTLGHFSVDVLSGGETREANVTASRFASGDTVTEQLIFDYFTYVDVGAGGFRLNDGSVVSIGDDEVTSTGSFTGSNGNTIDWTAVSSIADNSSLMETIFSFDAVTGSLGDISLFQYLDEDIEGVSDDVFLTRGDVASANLELFTVDNTEVYGVSHSGGFNSAQGLSNASFAGWAADRYNSIKPAITAGNQSVSTTGIIDNLSTFDHPQLGSSFGPADIVSVLAWDVDSSANSASILTSLGGVPDFTAIDDPDPVIDPVIDPVTDPDPVTDLDPTTNPNPTTTPEPTSLFGLMALGTLGLLKRKKSC